MKTSELIQKLVDSLASHGDLLTNINSISWLCPSEEGRFTKIILHEDNEVEDEI